jgi:hypothetical protein
MAQRAVGLALCGKPCNPSIGYWRDHSAGASRRRVTPTPRGMAGGHPVATVVIDATDQQGFGLAAHERVMGAMLAELGLHRGKEITIEDGGLARKDFALEGDLADIEPIVQEMGERVKGIPPMVRREF